MRSGTHGRACLDCASAFGPRGAPLAAGLCSHHGRGLCEPCYRKRRSADTLIDVERPSLSRDELLHEWAHYDYDPSVSHKRNIAGFAARIGRTAEAMGKATVRAGITAAKPQWAAHASELTVDLWLEEGAA